MLNVKLVVHHVTGRILKFNTNRKWGDEVAQLVEALLYKTEARGFDSQLYLIPSGRTMDLGLTQLLTEMSTSYISWWVKVAGG